MFERLRRNASVKSQLILQPRALPVLIALAVLGYGAFALHAQSFPWDIFKTRTVKDVISITLGAVRPSDSMFFATSLTESKADVTFTGQSKSIGSARQGFIKSWVGVFGRPAEYADLYQREFLFKEGDKEYWLATEEPITKYFDKELKPGDKMTIYLISIGAYRSNGSFDPVLLVEEYQTIKKEPESPKTVRLDQSGFHPRTSS